MLEKSGKFGKFLARNVGRRPEEWTLNAPFTITRRTVASRRHAVNRCDEKIQYLTADAAERAVDRYYERVVLSVDPVEPYKCRAHGCYHIGHTRPVAEISGWQQMWRSLLRQQLQTVLACSERPGEGK
jgi:hypothetical protein